MPDHDHHAATYHDDRRPWRPPVLSRLDAREGTKADQYGFEDEDDIRLLAS